MELKAKVLTDKEISICKKTISHTAIFWLLQHHLLNKQGASILRFADGEYRVIEDSRRYSGDFKAFGEEWNKSYGLYDIDIQDLSKQLVDAGNSCRYLAPSISGLWWNIYAGWDKFNERDLYVDNFYPYGISGEMIKELFKASTGICYIHRDCITDMSLAKIKYPDLEFSGYPLSSYQDIPATVEYINKTNANLILLSGGPIGKVLGPIAESMGKVLLDIGSAMFKWC